RLVLSLSAIAPSPRSMWSTILSLSLSTVFGILGLCGIIFAAASSNWIEYNVNRREIVNTFNREPELNIKLKDAFIRDPLYFSRTYGLFLTCFNDAVPSDIGSFNYLTLPCVYYTKEYMPSEAKVDSMSSGEVTRLWVMRATAILYAVGLFIAILALTMGIFACWRVSSRLIVAVGVMLVLAVVCLGLAMAGWHYTQYQEQWILEEAPFYKSWEPVLKSTSRFHYGYSYVVSWIGIASLLVSSVCMLIANCYVKRGDEKAYESKDAYMMNHFYDKGGAAVVPYYNTYSAGMDYGQYGAYPPAPYGTYGAYGNAYPYGYMTYGR
ncbi:hypothetical protein PENTCL1PPCAC_28390, partial [Pristionchus entomophagus]